jgi:hypothetical protein
MPSQGAWDKMHVKNPVITCKGRDGRMKRLSIVSFVVVAMVGSAAGLYATDSETGASSRPDPHHYKSFEYTQASKTVRLIIPDGLAVVRGILVVGPYARADSRDYRAYSTYDRPLKIISPHAMSARGEVWDAGSSAVISIDDTKFAGWKKLELYDGAKKVSELTKGPAEFTVYDLKAGYHAFCVLGTDGTGNIRPSNPVLVVVRKLGVTSQSPSKGTGAPL